MPPISSIRIQPVRAAPVLATAVPPYSREQKNREQENREQENREQDRRLERSLYEGHSIEAGLNFDDPYGAIENEEAYKEACERAYLADGDGSEPLFPYIVPHPDAAFIPEPDPEAVRGAILRLARESGRSHEPQRRGLQAGQPMAAPDTPPATTAFAEVARRVWAAGQGGEGRQPSLGAAGCSTQRQSDLLPDRLSSRTIPGPLEAHPDSTFADAALAHDACNLLSALGLYSDLLRSPGVLSGQYLRYAEELKLIAGRSQSLIDRLLRQGGVVPEAEAPAIPPTGLLHLVDRQASPARALSMQEPGGDGASGDTLLPAAQLTGIHLARGAGVAIPLDAAPISPSPATSLVDLLMRWGSLLSTLAHGTLDVSFGPDAATPVPVAPEPLERILVNLVKNARAATIEGGAIRIGVAARLDDERTMESADHGRAIVLTVDDSGYGMSEAQVNRILGTASERGPGDAVRPQSDFDRARAENFEEGDGRWPCDEADGREVPVCANPSLDAVTGREPRQRHARDGRRQGLGLQVVKELVEASGGRLAIASRVGRGTRIEIRWPVLCAVAAPQAREVDELLHRADRAEASSVATAVAASEAAPRPELVATAQASLPPPQAAIGPDGFSEEELRAMILRLHRTNKDDTGQGGPARNGRGAAATVRDRRGPAPSLNGRDAGLTGSETGRIETGRIGADNYSSGKGAIAC